MMYYMFHYKGLEDKQIITDSVGELLLFNKASRPYLCVHSMLRGKVTNPTHKYLVERLKLKKYDISVNWIFNKKVLGDT